MPRSALLRLALMCLLCSAGAAQAQYAWIDAKGVRHYADRPPPPGTPPARILQAPRPGQLPVEPAAAQPAAPAAGSALAEREAAYRKRQQDQADNAAKAQQEEEQQRATTARCEEARTARRQLESGVRVATVNARGERSYLDDAQRALRLAEVNRVLSGCR